MPLSFFEWVAKKLAVCGCKAVLDNDFHLLEDTDICKVQFSLAWSLHGSGEVLESKKMIQQLNNGSE